MISPNVSRWLRVCTVSLLTIAPAVATADPIDQPLPSFTQAGINDTTAGVPETGGSTEASGLASATVDPSTGIATATVPLTFPKARGQSQPRVGVSYSSVAGAGFAGWGWNLSFPEIERTTLSGPPTYNDHLDGTTPSDDRFAFNGQPLVPICQVGQCGANGPTGATSLTFSPEVPAGAWYFRLENDALHAQFFWFPSTLTWLIEFPSGETMELGVPLVAMWPSMAQNTIDFDVSQATQVPAYRWYVARQYDAQRKSDGSVANPIVYVWSKVDFGLRNALRSYLTDVFDTPPPTFEDGRMPAFAHHLHFRYESPSAPDPGVVDPPIWKVTPAHRLSGIDVTSATFAATGQRQQVRRYHFAYEEYNTRSYVDTVTTEGRCDQAPTEDPSFGLLPANTNCPSLPPIRFEYLLPETIPQTVPILGIVPDNATILDVNADGVPDFVGPGPTVQFLALNGVGLAANVLSQSDMPLQSGCPSNAANFSPVVSPGSFSAGVASSDGNVNPIWSSSSTFSVKGPTGDPTTNIQWTFYSQWPFLPSRVGTSWSWGCGAPIQLAPSNINSIEVDCSRPVLPIASTTAAAPLAVVDVDGDGLIDEVTATQDLLLDMTGVGTESCCHGTASDGSCIGGVCDECWQVPTDVNKRLGVHLDVRATGMNPDGSTNFFGSTMLGAVIADADNWPLLPDGKTITDFYEDMNGDGLADLVVVNAGLGDATQAVGYLPGQGNGAVGLCPNGGQSCSPTERADPPQMIWMSTPASMSTGVVDHTYAHDINGDGYADILVGNRATQTLDVYLNLDGKTFGPRTPLNLSVYDYDMSRVMFADMNGSGVDDVVIITNNYATYVDLLFGVRPGLLTIIHNGKNASTSLTYESTVDLARCSRGDTSCFAAPTDGKAWQSSTPQVMHVVTRVETTNNLGATLAVDAVTEYSYSDPVYDGRDRSFRGFRRARQRKGSNPVDTTDPPATVATAFLVGRCQEDYPNGQCPQYSVDRPFGAVSSLPLTVDTYDDTGHYLSTVHNTYHVQSVATGADGRVSRFAYPGKVQTFAYDSSVVAAGAVTIPTQNVVFDDGSGVVATGTMAVREAVGLGPRPAARAVAVEVETVEDSIGNLTDRMDWGRRGIDRPVHTAYGWYSPPGDVTRWIWRPHTQHVDPSPDPRVQDVAHDVTIDYDAFGNATDVHAVVRGTVPLSRGNGGLQFAPAPASSSEGSTILLRHVDYTAWGSAHRMYSASGSHCADVTYDGPFQQLAIQQQTYTGANCTGNAITSNRSYDRGFERVAGEMSPSNAMSFTDYEAFGRVKDHFKPDPATGALPKAPSQKNEYVDTDSGPQLVHTMDWDGKSYRDTWAYSDGLGNHVATLHNADMAAGDPNEWVVSGAKHLSLKGTVLGQYLPFFWGSAGTSGGNYPLASGFPSSATQSTFDAFGHQVQQFDTSATLVQQRVTRAFSTEIADGEQVPGGLHQGATLTTLHDGHGHTIGTVKYGRINGQMVAVATSEAYTSAGKVAIISQTSPAGQTVTRSVSYDSLGHMVQNVEPNTSVPARNKYSRASVWRYAYDDDGQLVGTSDARGCGENVGYDAVGRVLYEDFSPCVPGQQQTYSEPTGMDGTESFLVYDDASPMPAGRLLEVLDRGADTKLSYDYRDRVTSTQRRIATSGPPSSTIASRYAAHWYSRSTSYDDLDRPTFEGTGADSDLPQLLGPDGSSDVVTLYSARGTVSAIESSYGVLVQKATYAADGLVATRRYGDLAGTTATVQYDGARRPLHMDISRSAPPSWTGQPTQIANLEALTYGYDKVGHPTSLLDATDPAPWPNGAKPRASTLYANDDWYRIQDVKTSYGTPDSWLSPLQAEENAGDPVIVPVTGPTTGPATPLPTRVAHQTFSYDWLGNGTGSTDDQNVFYDRSLGMITNSPASGPGPNQLAGATMTGVSGGALAAQYDAAGNLIDLRVARQGSCAAPEGCNQHFIYSWDEVNQLAEAQRWDFVSVPPANAPSGDFYASSPASAPNVEVTYFYDASGRRVVRGTKSPAGTFFTAEVFPTLRLDHAEADDNGDYVRRPETESVYLASNSGALGRLRYVGMEGPTATGGLEVLLELTDTLGSTSFVVDQSTSELVERITYLPYGATESDFRPTNWGSFREPYRFTGKEDDSEVGLTYFGARYYAPGLGRFISPDPKSIHQLSGDLNHYAYVGGGVTSATDPTGLEGETGNGSDLLPSSSAYGIPTPWGSVPNFASSLGPGPNADLQLLYFLAGVGMGVFDATGLSGFAPAASDSVRDALSSGPYQAQYTVGYAAGFVLPTVATLGETSLEEGVAASASLEMAGARADEEALLSGANAAAAEQRSSLTAAEVNTEQSLTAGGCFVAGTPVWTGRGEEPIEQVRPGDAVLSRDETGTLALHPVTRVFTHAATDVLDVSMLDSRGRVSHVLATSEHPFWVEGRGWVAAGELERGVVLWGPDGLSVVEGRDAVPQTFVVHNFEVEGSHTYLVGSSAVLVHNTCSIAAEGASTIDTAAVRFSQDSVKGTFRNGTSLSDAAAALRAGGPDAARAYPPIRLFSQDGALFTLDNRRLLVFSEAGLQVPFRMATDAEVAAEVAGQFTKFTTTAEQGWGQFITVRGGP
jgi:RHS repeat-associated protein